MKDEMRALAVALLRSGQTSGTEDFPVQNSTDHIVVTVTRVDHQNKGKAMVKLSERAAMVPYGSGQTCGACGGTGRL